MNNSTDTHESPNPGRLIVDRQSPGLRTALWGLVRQAKDDVPLTPVTVVAPSRYVSLSLRQELGREGFANVRFIELPVLAELLGAAALAGRRPLTGILERIHLRQVLSQTDGPLAPVGDHRSTQSRIRESFRELRHLDEAALTALESRGGVPGEMVRLYREFRHRTAAGWYDVEDLTTAASVSVRRNAAPALADLGQIVFYLPRSVSPAEAGLLEALAERGRCAVVLGSTGDKDADASVQTMATTLAPILGNPRHTGDEDTDANTMPGEARLHVAPNTHEELRWVIRQIMGEANENRTPFYRMAILYRMENPYGTLIRDELRLAGLPIAGPGRDSLADTAVGHTLVGLLELADSDLPRVGVMAWLTGCPVRPTPDGGRSGFYPSRWDFLSRQAGIVGGLEQWRDRLGRHARQLTEDANRREAAEEITEARAYRMREEAATANRVLAFIEKLAADVDPPAAGSSWSVYCDWANRLLDDYLSPSIPDLEFRARERIGRALEELRGADIIHPSTTLQEFRQTVADAIGGAVGHLGTIGQGVFVSSFAAARGISFDVVWLVGMIEGGTPPSIGPDPLLPEPVWREAGGPPRPEQRIASERYDYLSAVASAPRRFLSYPVADAASQRQAHPSRWLLEQASALEGRTVHTRGLARLGERPWLSRNLSAEQTLAALPDTALADVHDYHLNRLLLWRNSGEKLSRHPLARQGTLARANRLSRSRNLRRLTEFDGNLSDVAGEDRFISRLQRTAVSPTSLENWAACPYRYFLGHVLRLSALESPEETAAISPLERGSLIHGILEKFVTDTQNAGAMPAPGQAWDEDARRRLLLIAKDKFVEAEARGVTGKPLLWDLVKQDIRDDLTIFLEEDSRLRAKHDTKLLLPEVRFGLGGDTMEVSDDATGLRFRGVIDRLDISTDGTSALVIDYKTGSSYSYDGLKKDPIDKGKRLQLGVYSMAARQLVSTNPARVSAAYWFTTARGRFRLYPPDYFEIDNEETVRRFRYGVSTIVDGIRHGVFPANPGLPEQGKPANCRFCDFDLLCPSRRADIWERKKTDPMLTAYRQLADGEAEEADDGGD